MRLLARNNEVLSTKRTDDAGHVAFEANLTRGEGSLAPALIIAADARGDYAFLSLKTPAFDLTDRGVAGRVVPSGLDAFVYAERGVYRSGETVHLTALLRDPQGVAATGTPLTLVVERPDGVEYRRTVVADQGLGGRSLDVPLVASSPTGTWRARAFTDPKRPAVGETTFMVEDYVPDRLEFDLATSAKSVSTAAPAEITLDGRYLYGAPAAGLDLEGEVVIGPASERAGFPRYAVRPRRREDREDAAVARQPADDGQRRQGQVQSHDREAAGSDPAAGSAAHRAHGGSGRPRCRAQDRPAGDAVRADDRRQASVLRQLARRRRERDL